MDPAWVSIAIGLIGALIGAAVGGAIWYGALRAWMATREAKEHELGVNLGRLQTTVDRHEGVLGEHAVRIGVLEATQE